MSSAAQKKRMWRWSSCGKPGWQVTVQKTGYIAAAGRCLVMQAVIEGRDVVIVLLNSWGKLTRIADAKRVRDWVETSRPFDSG